MAHIVVLLAAYNGADYIAQQLDSILAQTLPPTQIIVSDDGSSDTTRDILEHYSALHPGMLLLLNGPGQGSAANFMFLLTQVPEDAAYAAFSDQDDDWLVDKLARATAQLNTVTDSERPALYGARTIVTNEQGENRHPSRETVIKPSFRHALVQNFAGGNTMVMNQAALTIAARYARIPAKVPAHDWWLYQLVTAHAGKVIYDPNPVLLYRQHAANLIGNNRGKRAGARRVLWLLKGRYRDWNTHNLEALLVAKHTMSPQALELINRLSEARSQPFIKRIRSMWKLQLKRQGWDGFLGLWLGVILNKL